MTQLHESTPINADVRMEQPRDTVGRFVEFTRHPFETGEFMGDVFWTTEVNKLYGDEEMSPTTGGARARDIESIREDLETALIKGGLDLLKATFFVRLHKHTDIVNTGGYPVIEVFRRIIAFE